MKYSVGLPTGGECGDPQFLVELAELAEASGWDGVLLEESVGSDASFTHFGEERNPRVRAELLDEALEIIAGLWTGEPFSFRGQHFVIDQVAFLPPPVQRPRIPIWVGGAYPQRGPTERALRWDGACLYHREGRPLAAEDVRDLRRRAGDRPFDILAAAGPG